MATLNQAEQIENPGLSGARGIRKKEKGIGRIFTREKKKIILPGKILLKSPPVKGFCWFPTSLLQIFTGGKSFERIGQTILLTEISGLLACSA